MFKVLFYSDKKSINKTVSIKKEESVIQNIVMSSRVIVAAGSVVIRNIEDNNKVAGVPAKPINN